MRERTSAPTGAAERPRLRRDDPVYWLTTLFVISIVLMRFAALPNAPITLTTALIFVFCYFAYRQHILTIEPGRFQLWLAAAGLSAVLPLVQLPLVPTVNFSFSSWALWHVLWLPAVFRITDPSPSAYLRTCRSVSWAGFGFALLSLTFLGSQAAGIPYRDYFADFVPRPLQVIGFATTVPITWGNPIHKSNAWVALEPSFVSFILGATLLAALISGQRWWVSVTIIAGLLSSFAGSGLALLALAAVIMLLSGQLLRYSRALLAGAVIFALSYFTPVGTVVFSRVDEVSQDQSSTALRATLPYEVLVPEYLQSLPGMIFGYGAGSSRQVVDGMAIPGLLVPNPAKLIFDYGLLVGALLILVVVAIHLQSPAPAIALPILASFLFLQAATQPMITVLLVLATWWAPSAFQIPRDEGRLTEAADWKPPYAASR
ncbi:MAG: hypothetical protein LCH98_14775 [Actinobacteria bacterium]|nr:hypothetical protein [Actinomycetota bacterium]